MSAFQPFLPLDDPPLLTIADISVTMFKSVPEGSPMLLKDHAEHPVPELLRSTFRQIADAFIAGDFQLRDHPIAGVRPIDSATAKWIADNISAYGEMLAPLNEETWDRSIYRWMEGYWQMLVDLTTRSEPVSDLTLHTKLYETGGGWELVVEAVYVP